MKLRDFLVEQEQDTPRSDLEVITPEQAVELIDNSKGKMFDITFQKKDGTIRRMNARTQVKKGVTGAGLKFDPREKGLIPVFDIQKDGFRMINLSSLRSLRIDRKKYLIRPQLGEQSVADALDREMATIVVRIPNEDILQKILNNPTVNVLLREKDLDALQVGVNVFVATVGIYNELYEIFKQYKIPMNYV